MIKYILIPLITLTTVLISQAQTQVCSIHAQSKPLVDSTKFIVDASLLNGSADKPVKVKYHHDNPKRERVYKSQDIDRKRKNML